MEREDKVWALLSLLFGFASPVLLLMMFSGGGLLGFAFMIACPLVGLGTGLMAFKRKSLLPAAAIGILLSLIVPVIFLLAMTGAMNFRPT